MAGDPGLEPGLADPESAVLPLDESPTRNMVTKAGEIRKEEPKLQFWIRKSGSWGVKYLRVDLLGFL